MNTSDESASENTVTIKEILSSWYESQDFQSVEHYTASDLKAYATIKAVIEDTADDYEYWSAIEYVYNSELEQYQAEKKWAEDNPKVSGDTSYIEYMQCLQETIDTLKVALDEWSQNEFGTPYTKD